MLEVENDVRAKAVGTCVRSLELVRIEDARLHWEVFVSRVSFRANNN